MDKRQVFTVVLVLALVSPGESFLSTLLTIGKGIASAVLPGLVGSIFSRRRRAASKVQSRGGSVSQSGGNGHRPMGGHVGGYGGNGYRHMGGHVGGYGGFWHRPMGGYVGRLVGCGMRTYPYVHRIRSAAGGWHHGDEKAQIMKELKDLRVKNFDTYHASMLIAADELSKDMGAEEAKQKLQYIDDMLSQDTANEELLKLLEEIEVEKTTREDKDEQLANQ